MRSPCYGCAREFDDKNEIECMRCALRLEYVGLLGPMTENVPIEQTDLVEGGTMSNGPLVTPDEKEFIRANLGKMKSCDMAKHLKRNINTVYRTINIVRKEERKDAEVVSCKADARRQADLPLGSLKNELEKIFSVRVGLFEKLKELSEAHFRTVEQELCWIVSERYLKWKRYLRENRAE